MNNTNLRTGNRLYTDESLALNRGLSGPSNDMPKREGMVQLAEKGVERQRPAGAGSGRFLKVPCFKGCK